MNLNSLYFLCIIFLFSGCQMYYNVDDYQKSLLERENISEENMCNVVSKDKNSWVPQKQKCSKYIEENSIKNFIYFKNKCNELEGKIEIIPGNTTCKFHKISIPFNKDCVVEFNKISQWRDHAREEAKKLNTIEELCQFFKNKTKKDIKYNENSRSCEFPEDQEVTYAYLFLERIVRENDNKTYKIQQIEKSNIKFWQEEAKKWKGSLDDLCENITGSKYEFNEKTLECTINSNDKYKKYEVMKPLLIDQHKRISEERKKILVQKEKEEKEKEIQVKNEWQERIGNSQEISRGKTFICESRTANFLIYPLKIKLDVGFANIQMNNSYLFNFIDSFKDYNLYQGRDNQSRIMNMKVYKDSLLKTTPYSLDIDGIGYYCNSN